MLTAVASRPDGALDLEPARRLLEPLAGLLDAAFEVRWSDEECLLRCGAEGGADRGLAGGAPLALPGGRRAELRAWGAPSLAAFLPGLAADLAERLQERFELGQLGLELANRYEELNLVYGVSSHLAREKDLRAVLGYILEESQATTGSDWALLRLRDPDILEGRGATMEATSAALQAPSLRRLSDLLIAALGAHPGGAMKSSPRAEAELERLTGRPASLLAVPILVKGRIDGFLAVAHLQLDAPFHTSEVRLMEVLAEQVSLALTNWELYENLRRFLVKTVRSLVSAIDAKDSYTRGHSERVHRISLKLGEALALPAEEMESLHWASLLHDVGKLGVPESILMKPGALTEEEFAEMRKHPVRSCEIVAPIDELGPSLDGIRHHHERFDGTGYPDRLRGEEIPFAGRIIAVADVFDALTSDRAYRKGLQPEEVRAYLKQNAGRQLDPTVVEAFDRIYPELVVIVRPPEEPDRARATDAVGQRDLPRAVPAAG